MRSLGVGLLGGSGKTPLTGRTASVMRYLLTAPDMRAVFYLEQRYRTHFFRFVFRMPKCRLCRLIGSSGVISGSFALRRWHCGLHVLGP